jgi:hypothetical protein
VTGPGDVGREKKGLRDTDFASLAPSTMTGRAGEGGLFEAEDWALCSTYSVAPSVCAFFVAGVVAFGEEPLDGVPNWKNNQYPIQAIPEDRGAPTKQNFWISSLYSADCRPGFSEDKASGRVPGTGAGAEGFPEEVSLSK